MRFSRITVLNFTRIWQNRRLDQSESTSLSKNASVYVVPEKIDTSDNAYSSLIMIADSEI